MPPSFGDQQRDSNIVHRKRNWNVDWMNWMPANRNVQSIWVCFYIFVKNNNVHFQTHWLSLDENTPKAVIAAPDSRMSISVVDMCRENIIGEVGFSPFYQPFLTQFLVNKTGSALTYRCPICLVDSDRIAQLIMGMESAFHLDSDALDYAFNPCGHVASQRTVR